MEEVKVANDSSESSGNFDLNDREVSRMNELDSIEEMFGHLDMTSNMNSMVVEAAATAAAETSRDR